MAWRIPLLLLLSLLAAWYAFRGLVHLAFLFTAHPVATFLFAPALLPFAALPAGCLLGCARLIPAIWSNTATGGGRRVALTAGAPPVALVLAQFIDLVQMNLIRMMGIALPRLPLDPY
jgi:hypothetical protein